MAKKREPGRMTEGKKNIIAALLQEYNIQSAEDIKDASSFKNNVINNYSSFLYLSTLLYLVYSTIFINLPSVITVTAPLSFVCRITLLLFVSRSIVSL